MQLNKTNLEYYFSYNFVTKNYDEYKQQVDLNYLLPVNSARVYTIIKCRFFQTIMGLNKNKLYNKNI